VQSAGTVTPKKVRSSRAEKSRSLSRGIVLPALANAADLYPAMVSSQKPMFRSDKFQRAMKIHS
jgi:hypothetical protein